MSSPVRYIYEFGPFRIDTRERLLMRDSQLIPLTPKAVDTLLALIAAPGRIGEKEELIKTVWPDSFVEEGGLARNVSAIRKALGDTEEERYIETIPKRGYRFVAPVTILDPAQAQPESITTETARLEADPPPAAGTPSRKWLGVVIFSTLLIGAVYLWYRFSRQGTDAEAPMGVFANTLGVLPFRNVSNDPSQDYFAEGMTQALITDLAKLGSLRVISLASVPGGGGEPAALALMSHEEPSSLVLKGSVVRSGDRVRIDAQLLDPKKGAVHWANSYERNVQDVLALQSAVAEAIAHEIQVGISTQERAQLRTRRPVHPEALDAYMRGRYFWNRRTEESLLRAVQYFERAIAADAEYALAYSGLADSYSLLGSIGIDGMPPLKAMPLAKAAAEKALKLDAALAEAYVSLAYVRFSYDWDLSAAAKEFSRAMALNPAGATAHHWYGHYFLAAGDVEKAHREMQVALRLEPLSPIINLGVGWCLYYLKQYDKAIERYRAVLEMDPNYAMAHQTLGMAYVQKGMYAEAIEQFKLSASLSGDGPAGVASLAAAYAAAGRTGDAKRELARLEEMSRRRYVPALYHASVHEALGDTAASLRWFWKALGERSDYLVYLRVEPRAGKLLAHPEFIRILSGLHP